MKEEFWFVACCFYACLVLWEDYVSGYFFCFEFFGLQICDQLWGPLAKTMTEKAAWALARDKELDMVVINPAIVLGPKLLTSRASIMNYLQGMKELPQSGLFAYLHVEDLAQIHISALEITKASGRYICYERVVSEFELVELIRKLYPEQSVPSRFSKSGSPHVLTNQKLQTLGIKVQQV
jgi:cinnamoyl-CoA reductase